MKKTEKQDIRVIWQCNECGQRTSKRLVEPPVRCGKCEGGNWSAVDDDRQIVAPAGEAAIEAIADEIKHRLKNATEDILEIGKQLTEAKKLLGHGNFLPWIEAQFQMSADTAQNFMRAWTNFGQIPNGSAFGSKALYLLAAPSTPEEARTEAKERAAKGEKITHKTAKEIKARHTPKPPVDPDPEPEEEEKDEEDPPPPPPSPTSAGKFPNAPWVRPPFCVTYPFSELSEGFGKTSYGDSPVGIELEKLRASVVDLLNRHHDALAAIGTTRTAMVRYVLTVTEDIMQLETSRKQPKK